MPVSEAHYRELIDDLDSVVAYEATAGGENFVIRVFNPAAACLEGTTPEAVIGRLVTEAIPSAAASGLLDALRRVWKTGQSERLPTSFDEEHRLSGRRESYIHRLPSGWLVAAYDDVSERTRAEQAAAERAHFLEQLLEAIPVAVFYKDTAGRFLGCNTAFSSLVNRSREEIIGKAVLGVYEGAISERNSAADREALAHPERQIIYEQRVPGVDGRQLTVRTQKGVFSDIDGAPAGIVGVDLDVTEIREAEKELAASAVQLRLSLKAAVAALGATIEMRDPYTAGHQRRVAELARAIAAELGWREARLETLQTAALLHDIGKIVVPAEILAKPGRLTESEMALIRQHAAAGADIVVDIDFEGGMAEIIRQHHERLDGSGYPSGLRDGEILPEARVLAVADVVEAMISHRPYRPSLTIEEALTEIENGSGLRYEAPAVAACVRLFRERGFKLSS